MSELEEPGHNHQLSSTLNLDIPVGLYRALERLAKIRSRGIGISSYARDLLNQYQCQDLPEGPEKRRLSIRLSAEKKTAMRVKAEQHGMSPAEYGRRCIAYAVSLELLDLSLDPKGGKHLSLFGSMFLC